MFEVATHDNDVTSKYPRITGACVIRRIPMVDHVWIRCSTHDQIWIQPADQSAPELCCIGEAMLKCKTPDE